MNWASESSNLSSSCLGVASSNLVTQRVGSSNLSTSVPRDFKSVVSDGFESRPVAGMKTRCSQQGFETPRGRHPQEAVNTGSYPRINTHKCLRINTHKTSDTHALTLTKSRINTHKVWPAAQRTQGFWRASFIFFLYLFYLIDMNPLFAPPAR